MYIVLLLYCGDKLKQQQVEKEIAHIFLFFSCKECFFDKVHTGITNKMRGTAGVLGFLSVFLVVAQGAPSWKVVSQDMANTVFAIAFQNETTGFLPAGVDGQGAAVLRSTDAGRTWHSEAGVVGLDLLAAEAEATNVVASGMFSIVVSNDNGKSFHEAGTDMPLEGMQDVCAADSQYFGIPGAGLGKEQNIING